VYNRDHYLGVGLTPKPKLKIGRYVWPILQLTKTTEFQQPPPTRPDLCWQPPPSMQQHIGSLETHEIKIEQPQLIQSQQRGSNISGLRGHLPTLSSASATGVLTSPSTVNEDTTVQGTSQII
jgi:hypothetical protein